MVDRALQRFIRLLVKRLTSTIGRSLTKKTYKLNIKGGFISYAKKRIACLFMLVFLLTLLVPTGLVLADDADIIVSPGDSIQDAIDEAEPGNTILIKSGEYIGGINIDKPLTLKGEDGAIIESEGQSYTIGVLEGNVTIDNLKITGAKDYEILIAGENADDYSETDRNKITVTNCSFESVSPTEVNAAIAFTGIFKYADIIVNNNKTNSYKRSVNFYLEDPEVYNSNIEIKNNIISNEEMDTEYISIYAFDLDFDFCENLNIEISNNQIIGGTKADNTYNRICAMFLNITRNSKITITDNKLTNVATAVIYDDYSSESDLVIKGNNLSFSEGESSDESAFDLALYDGCSLLMEDNYIEQYDVGLLIYECSFGSSMTIRNNTIEGPNPILLRSIGDYQMGYQALSDIEGTEPIDIEISKNRLLAKEVGIIVEELLDSETNPINLIISDNIISSDQHGFAVNSSIELNNPSSAVMIVGNKINAKKSNILVFNEPYWAQGLATTMALTDLEIMEEGQDILPLIVRYNSLSNEAAVDNWAEGNLDIRLNWWGSDEGPDQDLLLGNILYDPWMASLDLDASIEDGKVTALFSLLDSDGEKISDQGLSIRFTVSGANSLTQDIAIIDGLARLEYDSTADGTDTIKAELVFAGETDGLEVEETLKVNSKEPEESPEPTDEPQESPEPTEEPKESPSPSPTTDTDGEKEEVPKTGDKSLSLVYYGLLLALSGLVLFYKRVRALMAK